MKKNSLSHKEYLGVAVPFMLATVTQPLLGAVDTAVIGSLNEAALIAGVSIGTTLFNTIYWLFGFLRVSTTSYSAKALGAGDEEAAAVAFLHPMLMVVIAGMTIVMSQQLIWQLAMLVLGPESAVQSQAYDYYRILIWGAPFVLGNYVFLGWLMGQAQVKITVGMQLLGNIFNIILDIVLVKVFHKGIMGVALATLVSQLITFVWGFYEINKRIPKGCLKRPELWKMDEVLRKVAGGKDLMLRTVCLLITNNIFMRISASFGTTVLAGNTILLQIESMMAYLFDGLANASSTFAGRAVGEKNSVLLRGLLKRTLQWSSITAILLSLYYAFWKTETIMLFTGLTEVIEAASDYGRWLLAYPALAGFGLSLYGIFTGMMMTKAVRNATFYAMCLFLVCNILGAAWGNHMLWVSYILFYFGRGFFLLPYLRKNFNEIT